LLSQVVQNILHIPEIGGIITCSLDSFLKILDLEQLEEKGVFSGHTDGIRCFWFSKEHKVLVSGGLDRKV
jgi:WD40 repeat protein